MRKYASCDQNCECFAKLKTYICGFEVTKCTILSRTDFGDRECPFAKPEKEVTNGIFYKYNYAEYAEMINDK